MWSIEITITWFLRGSSYTNLLFGYGVLPETRKYEKVLNQMSRMYACILKIFFCQFFFCFFVFCFLFFVFCVFVFVFFVFCFFYFVFLFFVFCFLFFVFCSFCVFFFVLFLFCFFFCRLFLQKYVGSSGFRRGFRRRNVSTTISQFSFLIYCELHLKITCLAETLFKVQNDEIWTHNRLVALPTEPHARALALFYVL